MFFLFVLVVHSVQKHFRTQTVRLLFAFAHPKKVLPDSSRTPEISQNHRKIFRPGLTRPILDSPFSILDFRLNFPFSILDRRFSILDSPFSILYFRFSILDFRFLILDLRFSILDSRLSILDSRFWILNCLFSILDSLILASRFLIFDS